MIVVALAGVSGVAVAIFVIDVVVLDVVVVIVVDVVVVVNAAHFFGIASFSSSLRFFPASFKTR